jgi:hypothetical protein
MSHSQFSLQRAALGLLLSAAAIVPAAAQQADSLTVTRDPATGQLRAATAAEQATMRAAAQSQFQSRARIRVAAPRVQQKVHASGARGVRVTDEMLSSSVAVRAPDGHVEVAHTPEEAAALARSRTEAQSHVAPNPVTE